VFIERRTIADRPFSPRPHLAAIVGFLSLLTVVNRVSAQRTALRAEVNAVQSVDLGDYSLFADCMAGPGVPPDPNPPMTTQACLDAFDLDSDDDVDLFDFTEFLAIYTGPICTECYNRVFVSSVPFASNLGSAVAYDVQCNQLATAAGLNNPTNNAFIAWMSDANSNARTRLGVSARGFVRVDGVAFADSQTSLFVNNAVFNPIRIDEYGNDVGAVSVMTGTNPDGTTFALHCTNWTGAGPQIVGRSADGPGSWTAVLLSLSPCQGTFRIYCMENTKTLALTPPPTPGKRIYLTTSTFVPGAQTPDQLCAAEKPPGVATVRALVARTTASAAALLNPQALYVRVDGQIVGTGAELAAFTTLRSGIWQTGSGAYVQPDPDTPSTVWTGSGNPTALGTTASTCNDWTSTVSTVGVAGFFATTQSPDWWGIFTRNCTNAYRLYCVEQ